MQPEDSQLKTFLPRREEVEQCSRTLPTKARLLWIFPRARAPPLSFPQACTTAMQGPPTKSNSKTPLLLAAATLTVALLPSFSHAATSSRCNIHGIWSGSVTNSSYRWDEDFNDWRPNVDDYEVTTSATVTWTFNGDSMVQDLTVWGQPLGGPTPGNSATDVGAVIQSQKFDQCVLGKIDFSVT